MKSPQGDYFLFLLLRRTVLFVAFAVTTVLLCTLYSRISSKPLTLDSLVRSHYERESLVNWSAPNAVAENVGVPGEMGAPVLNLSKEEEEKAKESFAINEFNVVVSDLLSLNRSLPDVRSEDCRHKSYPLTLPTTDVVIIFHNEALSTLLRTIHSVINRSPRTLLRKIILVDDASDQKHLGDPLSDYISKISFPISLFRSQERLGLIKARLLGAQNVSSSVITFLDSHCEVAQGWLEPLLSEISENRKTIVSPVIDILSAETFEYIPVQDELVGSFSWGLNFVWNPISEKERQRRRLDSTLPMYTPAMAGGIFSIDKETFYALGSYDDKMEIWGGENIELSLRAWCCGGTVKIIPCSHVGHIFRKISPYLKGETAVQVHYKNSARLAEVWMDKWKEFYYAVRPEARYVEIDDLSSRKNLRSKLECKDFAWYLKEVFPLSGFPLDYSFLGPIRHDKSRLCLNAKTGLSSCSSSNAHQVFAYTKLNQLMSNGECLDTSLQFTNCVEQKNNEIWYYNRADKTIRLNNKDLCLASELSHPSALSLEPCQSFERNQKWIMNE